jgi:signal transduction histidine kinase
MHGNRDDAGTPPRPLRLQALRPWRLQTRLLLAVGLVAVAAIVAVALAARQGTRREFLRFQELERRAASDGTPITAAAFADRLDGRCCATDVMRELDPAVGDDKVLIVLDDAGRSLVGTAGLGLRRLTRLDARLDGGVLTLDATRGNADGLERLTLRFHAPATRIRRADGGAALAFIVSLPPGRGEQPAAQFLGSLDRRLLWATILVVAIAMMATWLVARGEVRPLANLRDATVDLARGNLGRRVTPAGAEEIEALGRAFNAMAAELERQQALRRSLVNDVAHELRTPVTAMRCRLETLVDGLAPDPARALRDLHEDVLHLGRLVEDLQEVALAEARELRLATTDIVIEDVVRSGARAAGLEQDPRLVLDITAGHTAHADALRVRQMLLNLLANAARHTTADGAITVRSVEEHGEVRIEVSNTGPRLDEATLARLFDRFYRTDDARDRSIGGAGLGLAIVKHLAEAQGGRAWARSTAAGVAVGFSLQPRKDLTRSESDVP